MGKENESIMSKKSLEIYTAIILSIATVGSTWCAYQAKLWGSVQTFTLAASNRVGREIAVVRTEANQTRNLDVFLFLEYLKALKDKDQQAVEFFRKRFRPQFKNVIDAWLATNPLQNPNAPLHPFEMSEYELEKADKVKQLEEQALSKLLAAENASTYSDNYIMLTVIFAMVLFFVGISTQFDIGIRKVLMIIGGIVLVFAILILLTYPIAPGMPFFT